MPACERDQFAGDVAARHGNDLHRQRKGPQHIHQLGLIGDADESFGRGGNDFPQHQRIALHQRLPAGGCDRPAGAALANQHRIIKGASLGPGESLFLTLGLTLAATDVVSVKTDTANGLAFSLFGTEIS